MDKEKLEIMRTNIIKEIEKIDNKDFSFYFYVTDTKGVPSGSLSYIYDIALSLKTMGYKVGMMHSEEDFVGVEDWMGKEYAELPHYNVEKSSVDISPSDVLFIPEIYANVMNVTKDLPCVKVAILQSFDRLTEFIPLGATWADLNIYKAITTSEKNKKRLNSYFPYVKTSVITPKISNVFNKSDEPKKLVVNVVTREQSDINKILKPFFWQYPTYQWVPFKELRGISRENFANELKDGAITIWVDDTTDFGYIPLEAMKCGSLVIGKIPNSMPEWLYDGNKIDSLSTAGIWVDNIETIPSILSSVIRTWTLDGIPEDIQEDADKLLEKYTDTNQLKDIKKYIIDVIIAERREEFVTTLESLNNKND